MVQKNCIKYDSIIILGPTATGKTSLSINLAKKLNTEIINADSMYIYKDLNIGNAKPTIEEMDGVVHHLIGFVDPAESYSVSQYRHDATTIINDMKSRNLIPIIVGGTGLYIDSLINSYSYGETVKDQKLRSELEKDLETYGKEYIYSKLKDIDPESAAKLHVNDTKRVIRALEIYMSSNIKKSEIINNSEPILQNPLIIGLNYDRKELYSRIDKRFDIMINNGLMDEIDYLYNNLKLNPEEHQSMKGIGYKEIVSYLRGEYSFEECMNKVKQHTRNYAKRQITWFKRNNKINWFNPLEDGIVDKILHLLQ
jgi:tRNA dimethylallyltransferase